MKTNRREHRDAIDIKVFVDSVAAEYVAGLSAAHQLDHAVTVFGSARTKPGHHDYQNALTSARLLSLAGYAVVTGGGTGIMEAANRGAMLAGGTSVGLSIQLPFEEVPNPFTNTSVPFDHFPARKTCLIAACQAVLVFPGGFGTLDELFEVLTLIQTGKLEPMPVVLVGRSFWAGLQAWIRQVVLANACVSESDLDLFQVADTPTEAITAIGRWHPMPELVG